MENQDIIMLCQQNWDIGIATSAKNLAQELAKNNRLLYVNMPLDINTVLRAHRKPEVKSHLRTLLGQTESLVQAGPNTWVLTPRVLGFSINWLSLRSVFKLLNHWNSELLASSIRQAAQALDFQSYYLLQDGIIFQGLELKTLLAPRSSIYYLRDYTITVPYFQRHGAWIETQLLKQADTVVTNSLFLNDYASQHNPHSYVIGQGYALSMYEADTHYPAPLDLAALAHPLIGYTGYLTALRLDIDLLVTIAQQRPQWNLVLIGPEDETFQHSLLHKLPNVFFLGGKSPKQLAAYLNHFDVCINPQLVNDITIGNYPLKIDEYLAMGKPVVATATRAMEMFADYVYLGNGIAQWLELLETALADHSPAQREARVAFAKSHTWAAVAQKLYEAVAVSGPALA